MGKKKRRNQSSSASKTAGFRYPKIKKIADGSFGVSVSVYKKMDGDLCAGKEIPKKNLRKTYEKEILKDVGKHAENVVHYIDTEDHDTFMIFFMELCDATVDQYVANKRVTLYNDQEDNHKDIKAKDYFDDITPLQICEQAVKGIEYLHKCDIIHRDVKSSNFLMVRTKAKPLVKVSDFGLSRQLPPDEHGVHTKSYGTPEFAAPECYKDVEQTKAIDIFSLGILIYYVLTDGRYPFGKEIFEQESNIRYEKSPNMQDLLNNEKLQEETKITACDLIKRMIKHTASDRFTIEDVVAHPFFWNSKKKVDFYLELNNFMQDKDLNQHFRKLNESQGKVDYYEKLSKCDAGLKENGKDGGFKTLVISHSNLPKPIKDDPRFKYGETIKDLLRLIRNMNAHLNEKSDEIKELLGMHGNEINWEKFLLTLTGSYPELLVHLYEFFRNSKVAVQYYRPACTSIASSSSGNVAISSRETFYCHEKNLSVDSSHIDQDLHSTEDEHCNKLQEMLKQAATIASATNNSRLIKGKKLNKVDLEIVRDAISQYESGHYHRREDFEKVLKNRSTPAGNIDVEKLLEYSLKEAKKEAETQCDDEDAAKQHYIIKHGNIIAVIGQAGIGKTTVSKLFTKKVLDESFGEYDYVFYISVRNMNFETKTNLLQFLVESALCDFPNEEWSKDIMSNLLKKLKDNRKVVIVLDGLDEAAITDSEAAKVGFDEETTAESFIKNLLNGRLLPHAKKLITSRPGQLYELHHTCIPHFIAEVLGLSKDSQLELCQQICGNNEQVEQVMQFLKDHPDIASYCYVPVNCTLTMDAIHKGLTDSAMKPSFATMTGIMTYTLVNFAALHSKSKPNDLKKVCKLAYNGIFKDVLVFKKVHTKEVEIDDATLNAFMYAQPNNTSFNINIFEGGKHFSFSHKIWQEFFCAIYIILFMSSDEFKNHPQKFTQIKWKKVLEFMFGISKDPVYSQLEETFDVSEKISCVADKWNALETIALKSVPSCEVDDRNENATKQLFQLCVLVHEAQDKVLRDEIAAALPSDIVLSVSLLPSDVTSLHYVLSGRSTNLNMSLQVTFVEESFKILFDKMATSECRHIQMPKVHCFCQTIDDDSAKALAACLSQIQELSLQYCKLSASGVEYISSGISKLEKQMELLRLRHNPIDDKGAEYLSSCLKNINQLNIRGCNITDAGVHYLSTAISKLSRPMKRLDLSTNPIGDKGAEYLSSCLKNINQLIICHCNITDAGFHHLSTAISKLSRPMKRLDLSTNPIGDKGAEYLSSCLKNINQLIICHCNITDAGFHHLSTAISKLSRPMELLDLSHNPSGDKGAEYLSSCLKNINQLDISKCIVANAVAFYLCLLSTAILKLSRPMKLLSLDKHSAFLYSALITPNKIGLQGATALTSCLANIERLDIYGCEIPEEGIKLMQDAMTSFGYKTKINGLEHNITYNAILSTLRSIRLEQKLRMK